MEGIIACLPVSQYQSMIALGLAGTMQYRTAGDQPVFPVGLRLPSGPNSARVLNLFNWYNFLFFSFLLIPKLSRKTTSHAGYNVTTASAT